MVKKEKEESAGRKGSGGPLYLLSGINGAAGKGNT